MPKLDNNKISIAVIGLGYVGLPLAIALAKHFTVTGFDINKTRISQLKSNLDKTNEISQTDLEQSSLILTDTQTDLKNFNIYIITVPTPIDKNLKPDLSALISASTIVGKHLTKNSIIVYESTVYPGVTENICGKILQQNSGLTMDKDFFLGYSPERINPGDKVHTLDKITKVIAGQNTNVTKQLQQIYGAINQNNIFIAKNIQTAEAAKVIENTQRDINIAFINEITTIVNKLNISIYDVLEAANTKWNFLEFYPGLVGGHCIGVDPYYLAHCAREIDLEPKAILAGREINENMSKHISQAIHKKISVLYQDPKTTKILILGLTFKEDIPDLRNTKVIDLIQELKSLGYVLDVHDPLACPQDAWDIFDIRLIENLQNISKNYHCIINTTPHSLYKKLSKNKIEKLLLKPAIIADLKHIWHQHEFSKQILYWTL